MHVRSLKTEDIEILKRWHQAAGYQYEFPENKGYFEAALMVVNENDVPIMAVAAERLAQLYLFCGDCFETPHAKQHAIRLLHGALGPILRAKGYAAAEAFLPPEIERSFGKRLQKIFGWTRNWNSYCVRF